MAAEIELVAGSEAETKSIHKWLENIIFRYFHVWTPVNCQGMIKSYEIVELCLRAREYFWQNKIYKEVPAPVTIVGDIHGQYEDLIQMFNMNGWPFSEEEISEMGKAHYMKIKMVDNKKEKKVPTQFGAKDRTKGPTNYIFLGDYVDRGPYSMEVIMLLFAIQLRFPERITLLRGNHESRPVNKQYGFYAEVAKRFSERIYEVFQLAFYCMPLTAIVGKKIMCMHGGISEELTDLAQLDLIKKPFDIPDVGIIADLAWADPEPTIQDYQDSPRGAAKIFGVRAVEKFCDHFDLDLIVRAHQVVQDGYEFFANKKLVTIFSAPYYCATTNNVGAVLSFDANLLGSFNLIKPILEAQSHSDDK